MSILSVHMNNQQHGGLALELGRSDGVPTLLSGFVNVIRLHEAAARIFKDQRGQIE